LTRSLVAAGDAARSEQEVATLMKARPDLAIVQALAGHVALLKGDPTRARALFLKALSMDPYVPEALAGLLAVDANTPSMAATIAQINQRQTERPTDVRLLLLTARAHTASGNIDGAEKLLRRAIELNPSSTDAYALLGQLHVKRGNLDLARKEFEAWAERDTGTVVPQTMVGIIYQIKKDEAGARRWYEKALSVDPRSAVAANNLAWLYTEGGGNLDVALQLALAAHGAAPDVPEYADTLGWVYLKKGMAQQAADLFEQSVRKDPGNAVYAFHLGLAHLKTGDSGKARRSIELALKMAPTFDGADEARKTLESLER
jgi:tetratricopeptide (TPR) repeat protein